MVGRRGRQAADALLYAGLLTTLVIVVATVVSFALGGRWLGVKFILFFVGFGAFGLGAFMLRPTAPYAKRQLFTPNPEAETRFQGFVARLIPEAYRLAPEDRLSDGARLFLAAVFMLVVSYAMETVFGITR